MIHLAGPDDHGFHKTLGTGVLCGTSYPALILRLNGEIDTVVAVRIDDGLITGLYAVRHPEKLSRMERETAVSR